MAREPLLNGTGVSISGHTHTVANITDFGSGVSGLFPSTLVYTTGNQSISGNKTYSGTGNFDTAFRAAYDGSAYNVILSSTQIAIGQGSIDVRLAGNAYYDSNGVFDATKEIVNKAFLTGWSGSNAINTLGTITTGSWSGTVIATSRGGTGYSSYSNGQILIGSGTSLVANTLSSGTGITIINGSGTITIGTTGLQSLLSNPVTGTGLGAANSGYLTRWTLSSGINNSIIYQNGSNIGIGTLNPTNNLEVSGTTSLNGSLIVSSTGIYIKDPIFYATSTDYQSFVYDSITYSRTTGGYTSYAGTNNWYVSWDGFVWTLYDDLDQEVIYDFLGGGGSVSGVVYFVTSNKISTGQVSCTGLINCNSLYVNGADLTYGGQPPSLNLKGYTWFGANDGSAGIGCVLNSAGTFGSSAKFFGFQGFNETVTQYNPICLASNYSAQVFLNTDGNVGINTTTPGYKLDVNGTANIATSLRINAATVSTIAGFDSSKNIVSLSTSTYPSLTELSYVKGLTSSIQTQINSKQNTLTNPVTGTGTSGYITRWNSSSGVNNSIIYDNGTNIGIGITSPSSKLHISGIITQSPVHASAGLSTDQTIIAASGDTVLQLTDKDDPNNWWNASTYRFLPTVSGYYFIAAQVNWDPGTGSGQINAQLRKNGTTFSICQNQMVIGVTLTQNLNGIVNLNGSTDYVDLTAYTSTTSVSQIVNGTNDRSWTKLEAYKIS